MASNFRPHAVVFIIIGISFIPSSVNSIPTEELDSMLDTLRIRGYELFCNAIVTSDLQFELLSGKNDARSRRTYTFFAPMDYSLFALDMTLPASSYVDTLRSHIVPRRLSITNLLRLPAVTPLPTLLFRRFLNVTHSPGSVSVDGVNVTFPGLFYGRHVAVHGLNGIINLRSSDATKIISSAAVGFRNRRSSTSRSGSSSTESHLVMAPSPTARPPQENIPLVNRKAHASAGEPSDANSHFHAVLLLHQEVHSPEQLNPLDNQRIHAPDDSPSLAASPFNPVVHPLEPLEPNSLDNVMIHPPENSHSHVDLLFNRAVDPPESDEPDFLDDIMILAPEDSHAYAASPFNQAVHPPQPDKLNSLDNAMILAPEDSQVYAAWQFKRAVLPTEPNESSSLNNHMIHTPKPSHSPASTTESPANVYVLPPVASHALTPTSDSPEYRHSSISAPPLEYSDAEVPTAMSPDVWLPNKHGVELIETFKGDSDGLIKMGHYAEVPKMPHPLIGAVHCVDPDVCE